MVRQSTFRLNYGMVYSLQQFYLSRNGQAKHISVEQFWAKTLRDAQGQVATVRQSTFRLNLRCMLLAAGALPVAMVRQSTIRLNDIKRRLGLGCVPHVATVNQSTIVAILR